MGRRLVDLLMNATFILTLVEAVLCLAGCALIAHEDTEFYGPRTKSMTVITVGGYAIITLAYLVCFVSLNEPITCNYFYILIFTTGAILNVVSGAILIGVNLYEDYNERTTILTVTTLVCGNCMFSTVILKLDYLRNRCHH